MAELTLGVLGEDRTDCAVIETLIGRIFNEKSVPAGRYKIHTLGANGCAHLRRKAESWMRDLADKGCRTIILVHDRDRADEQELRAALNAKTVPRGVKYLVCIPVEELEAWFFSCEKALAWVGGEEARSQVRSSPHLLTSPKERLIALSRGSNRKARYSPNENVRLAELLTLDTCAKRCPAFRSLRECIHNLV